MAGKFLNTTTAYSEMTNKLATFSKQLLDNPYYMYTDKKASECTYYNINTTMTTLDEATRGNYSEISAESPIRFNRIKNFLIYGITRIEPNLDLTEYGLEGNEVTGEAIILPKTIIPFPGDYFKLSVLADSYLFKVTAVNPNTLETGATLYRVNYVLVSSDGLKDIESQVVKTLVFTMSTGGIGGENGSNLATGIVDEGLVQTAQEFDTMLTALKDYYIALFYDAKVETFIYQFKNFTQEWHQNYGIPKPANVFNMQIATEMDRDNPFGLKVYDPYLIEFIIRNGLLNGSSTYIHVMQQMFLEHTFAIDYDRTIFSSIEKKKINKHEGRCTGNLIRCEQTLSLLYAHPEDYYYMQYHNLNAQFFAINIFDDPEFASRIINQRYYEKHALKNLIIKYMNDVEIILDDLAELEHIEYMSNKEFYYGIPLAIFCLEKQQAANVQAYVKTNNDHLDTEIPSQI